MNNMGNNKISLGQYCILIFILSQALFEGLGFVIIFLKVEQDSWLSSLLAIIAAVPIIAMFLYIINYEPDSNIFQKNYKIYGKFIGHLVNLLIFVIGIVATIAITSSLDAFSSIKYLIATPYLYVGGAFLLLAAYANIKGLETIARTAEALFIFMLIIYAIVFPASIAMFKIDNLKPFITKPIPTILSGVVDNIGIFFTPISTLYLIPKNTISNNKNFNKYVWLTLLLSLLNVTIMITLILGGVGMSELKMVRFSAFSIMRKIEIGNFFRNMEQFISLYFVTSMFIYMSMALHFIMDYLKEIFKIKKSKTFNTTVIVVSILIIIIAKYTITSSTMDLLLAEKVLPMIVGAPIFILTILSSIIIFIKRRKNKTA